MNVDNGLTDALTAFCNALHGRRSRRSVAARTAVAQRQASALITLIALNFLFGHRHVKLYCVLSVLGGNTAALPRLVR